jgi:hypothetical protein
MLTLTGLPTASGNKRRDGSPAYRPRRNIHANRISGV